MKRIIEIDKEKYEWIKKNNPNAKPDSIVGVIAQSKLYEERPQGDLADEVWKLYEKHQSHLATYVIEFGYELKDLLGKYQEGGASNDSK